MGLIIFYAINIVGITAYFIFNRKDNPDSLLLMTPYIASAVIISLAVLKTFLSSGRMSRSLCLAIAAVTLGLTGTLLYSLLRAAPGTFNIFFYLNSMRRYYGVFLIFLAWVGLDSLFGLEKLRWSSYLKLVVMLVAGEAIIESILLNARIISLTSLPVQLGGDDLNGPVFRPYGFLGSTTALGVFLLLVSFLCRGMRKQLPGWVCLLSFAAFAATFSVTAYLIFAAVLAAISLRVPKKLSWFAAAFFGTGMVFLLILGVKTFFVNKSTADYFYDVIVENWGMNWSRYTAYVHGAADVFFGAQVFDNGFALITQDFPYVSWLGEAGLLGIVAYACPVVYYLRRLEALMERRFVWAAIACIFMGMLHYPLIIFIPMQIFLGSLMFFASRLPSPGPLIRWTKKTPVGLAGAAA